MSKLQNFSLFLLRVVMGWFYFYAGITKVTSSTWTAAGYIKGASTATWFYHWLSNPQVLMVVDFMVKWGLTLLGVSLLLGLFVRVSCYLGSLLMLLFYIPILHFPIVGEHSYIVDEHIIYIASLLVLAHLHAGYVWGLDRWVKLRN